MQASPYWEIAAGYVGAMRAEIPFTSLYSQAVSLTLDETLITIRPRSTPLKKAPQASTDGKSAYNPGNTLTSPQWCTLCKYSQCPSLCAAMCKVWAIASNFAFWEMQ